MTEKILAPGQRVMFLLKEEEGEAGLKENKESHPALFTEMGELTTVGVEQEWRETARWVKFEEDVEEGGNRWSKPHVATLSLHSLFELRSCLLNGTVIIDMEADDLPSIVGMLCRFDRQTMCLARSRRYYARQNGCRQSTRVHVPR